MAHSTAWRRAAAVVFGLVLTLGGAQPAQAAPPRLVRVADRPCLQALLRVPTAFENVAPLVEPGHHDRIVTTPGADGAPMTELGLELKSCEHERIQRNGVTTSEDRVYELFVTLPAMYPDVPGAVTQYVLAIYTNSAKLHAAFAGLGLPSLHVSGIELRYEDASPVDLGVPGPPGSPGQMIASVPGPDGFSAIAEYARGFVPAQPITGAYFHPGPRGLVRDHHVAGIPFLVSAPLLSGSVSANEIGGLIARAMGGASASNRGGFFLDERGGFTGTTTIVTE